MYRFWFRELMGWLLVALGLGFFYICFAILLGPEPAIFEAPTLTVIGIFVFRGGIHLLKVAMAARIAMQAPAETARPSVERIEKHKPSVPLEW